MVKLLPENRILNDEQKSAVEFGQGPLLIIAGAGTGKTTVVTERIKHLITSDLARPAEIIALTFTEKAAREMEERVDQALPYGYTQMWISTFHSFCDRILRAESVHIGLNPAYRLLSEADATMLLRKNLFNLDLDYFRPLGNPNKFIGGMLQHFSRLKDEDVSPIQYLEWAQNQKSKIKNQNEEEKLEIKKYTELAKAYKYYDDLKIKAGVADFGDLITNALWLFRTRKNILKKYQEQFRYILVDEFQDTNIAQNELVLLLSGNRQNITAVCDDDQSIYKFRGAAVSNVLSFRKHFPKAELIVLSKNYRSTQEILEKSYQIIQHNNPDRLEVKEGINKKLISMRKLKGEKVEFIHVDRVENEADIVAKEIKKLLQKPISGSDPVSYKDFAILVRANNHAEPFVRAFIRHGIPYQFLGPGQLFRQPEIKELIGYLQLLNNFEDNVACFRVLSIAYFDISVRDLTALNNFSKKYGVSLFESCEVVSGDRVIEKATTPFISPLTKDKLTSLVKMINRHLGLISKETAGQILYYFLEDTGMIKSILEYKLPLDEKKANNITKFFGKLKTYEAEHEDASISAVLDWILLAMELGESPLASDTDWVDNDAVNILTVHSAKGLEFPIVFLVNLVSQRFPTIERREQIPIPDELIKEELPEGDYHEEEERRLFYVGMTRARDRLYLTAADFYGEGKREKKLSPFISEALGRDAAATHIDQEASQLSLLEWKKEEVKETVVKKNTVSVTYLSYSQIETFRICPLHYKLKYHFKIPTPPTPAMSFGISMHAALKEFYEQLRQRKSVSNDLLLKLLDTHWAREGYGSKTYESRMKERGKKYLNDFYKKTFDPDVKPVLLEEKFIVPIGKTRFLKIGGKIDRVDDVGGGKVEIIDYKTGRMPSKREVDTDLQLSMYALAATLIKDLPFGKKVEDVILALYFFDTQQKITTTRTQEQLEKEKEKIMAIAEEIEQSDFHCSGSQLCTNCEYKLFCGVE